jgi:hypothetical protein
MHAWPKLKLTSFAKLVEIRAAALAGDDRRLRALLDIVPPLRALHLQHVLHGTFT